MLFALQAISISNPLSLTSGDSGMQAPRGKRRPCIVRKVRNTISTPTCIFRLAITNQTILPNSRRYPRKKCSSRKHLTTLSKPTPLVSIFISSSPAAKTCGVARSHLRSLHSGNTQCTQNTTNKIDLTIVAGPERPARHTTDTLATQASPASTLHRRLQFTVLINRPQGRPRKRRSPRGLETGFAIGPS